MTIEIKQLIIRAVVEPKRESPNASSPPRRQRADAERRAPATSPVLAFDREALIEECTRQVLRELRKGRER